MTCDLWEKRLDAYVDGETPAQDLPALEDHLRTCQDCAAEALGRMQMKRATRAAAAMRFRPPAELRQSIQKRIAPKRSPLAFLMSPALAIAAAALLVLAIAGSSAMFVRGAAREQALAQLVDMHVAALASPNPVDVVSSDRHTVKPWFQGRLPFTFNLPELAGSQYSLRGGRLVYFRGQPGAQLMYELGRHELSVFIAPEVGATASGVADEKKNGFSTESWTAGGLRYVAMSDAGAGDVHALGEMIRGAQH
jgi:anti-sigma factor RsiW